MSISILVGFMVGLTAFSFIFTLFAMKYAIEARAKVIGLENSTHQIQYIDPKTMSGPSGDDLLAQVADSYGFDAKVNKTPEE